MITKEPTSPELAGHDTTVIIDAERSRARHTHSKHGEQSPTGTGVVVAQLHGDDDDHRATSDDPILAKPSLTMTIDCPLYIVPLFFF